jgi:hypothetical protein
VVYPERDAGAMDSSNFETQPGADFAETSGTFKTKLLKHRCEIGHEIELKSAQNQLEIATVNETNHQIGQV